MKRLRFRLERVLALRRLAERQALGEYALERARAEEAEQAAAAARAAAAAALEQLAGQGDRPTARLVGERVTRALDGRAAKDARRATDMRVEAERCLRQWQSRRIEAEAITRLKQRAKARHRTDFEAAEERERDERTSSRRAPGTGPDEALKGPATGAR